ncbi:MAG TPA: amidohydrolase family protein [Anaerovoracaceae bacterium]|nr:amidohydrolase family protein [Anaerovoracaceae bacterium]
MAFGFFKKNETADIIFMGGRIFTLNPDFPEVEAVACRDGIILDIGDYDDLSGLEGKNTEIVDLEGGVMLPGYIDTCGYPALNALEGSCLFLNEGGPDDIMDQISGYAASNPDAGVIFAYGYDETILEGVEGEQARAMLDKACGDKPAVVLGKSGFHCIINTAALEIVKAAAEEDEVKAVTIPYLLGILEPIDLEAISGAALAVMEKYCERGFTAVFDCGAPDFFSSIYQNILVHIYQENLLKQKYYGSLLITQDVNPKAVMNRLSQFRTNCVELNGYINFKTLKLIVEGSEENLSVSDEVLRELCVEAGDKGFDVHIDAWGEEAVSEAVEALAAARSAGYKKNEFTLVHDPVSDPGELSDTCYHLDVTEIVRTPDTAGLSTAGHSRTSGAPGSTDNDFLCIQNAKTVEEAVDLLTVDAAAQLGISGSYGSIERGKHADFVIFDENPFEAAGLKELKNLKAAMTVIDGVVVYDAKEDDPSTWHSMLDEQQD